MKKHDHVPAPVRRGVQRAASRVCGVAKIYFSTVTLAADAGGDPDLLVGRDCLRLVTLVKILSCIHSEFYEYSDLENKWRAVRAVRAVGDDEVAVGVQVR